MCIHRKISGCAGWRGKVQDEIRYYIARWSCKLHEIFYSLSTPWIVSFHYKYAPNRTLKKILMSAFTWGAFINAGESISLINRQTELEARILNIVIPLPSSLSPTGPQLFTHTHIHTYTQNTHTQREKKNVHFLSYFFFIWMHKFWKENKLALCSLKLLVCFG